MLQFASNDVFFWRCWCSSNYIIQKLLRGFILYFLKRKFYRDMLKNQQGVFFLPSVFIQFKL